MEDLNLKQHITASSYTLLEVAKLRRPRVVTLKRYNFPVYNQKYLLKIRFSMD